MYKSHILFSYADSSITKSKVTFLKQTSITTLDEIKNLYNKSYFDDFSVKLTSHTGKIDEDGHFTEDKTITYIAPAISFTSFSEDGSAVSRALYIHKGSEIALADIYLRMLFFAIISPHNNPYYDRTTINLVASKLSMLALYAATKYLPLGKAKYCSIFDYIFIKEFIVAYFSAKISPNNYYCWPNKENYNSAINDFFESFYLNNLNEINIPDDKIEYKNTYFFPTKRSNLVFLPFQAYRPKIEGPLSSYCRSTCIPLIYDYENSWKETYQCKIDKDTDGDIIFDIIRGKPWNFMELSKYLPDSKFYPISNIMLSTLEKTINFNYNVSELKFIKISSMPEYQKTNKEYKYLKEEGLIKETDYIMPGLYHNTAAEILYYFSHIYGFYADPNDEDNIFSKILNNPELIKNIETGNKDLDKFIKCRDEILKILKIMKDDRENKDSKFEFAYYNHNIIGNILCGFMGNELSMSINEYIDDFPVYKDYIEGTKDKST